VECVLTDMANVFENSRCKRERVRRMESLTSHFRAADEARSKKARVPCQKGRSLETSGSHLRTRVSGTGGVTNGTVDSLPPSAVNVFFACSVRCHLSVI
jgi:hypothetical protein